MRSILSALVLVVLANPVVAQQPTCATGRCPNQAYYPQATYYQTYQPVQYYVPATVPVPATQPAPLTAQAVPQPRKALTAAAVPEPRQALTAPAAPTGTLPQPHPTAGKYVAGPCWWSLTTSPGYEGYGIRYEQGVVVEQYRLKPAAQAAVVGLTTGLVATGATDAYGFTGWLNGVRASAGLSAVSYDADLESWAQQNNQQQNARGMGHFVMGPARRQNAAMGQFASIGAMWLASPAHRAALLDPSIRFIGLAGLGAYWTFNAN